VIAEQHLHALVEKLVQGKPSTAFAAKASFDGVQLVELLVGHRETGMSVHRFVLLPV
jgi:hypothetical protein